MIDVENELHLWLTILHLGRILHIFMQIYPLRPFSHSSRNICICKGMIYYYMDLGHRCKRIEDFIGGNPRLEVDTWNMIPIYKVKCMILGVLIIQGCSMISMTLFID